jgi:hypothetical protein
LNGSAPGVTIIGGWRLFARRAREYQIVLWLSVAYLLVIGPLALVIRITRADPLQIGSPSRASSWIPRRRAPRIQDLRRRW